MPAVRIAHAVAIASGRGEGMDRARVFEAGDDRIIVLADGAGGTGNGALAAQAIVNAVGVAARGAQDWCALLSDLDRDANRLGNAESTAVILTISGDAISGASVGDSGAWLLRESDAIHLSDGQRRKPLVGSGCVPFRVNRVDFTDGTLLVASDGLLSYAKRRDISRIARGPDLSAAAQALIDLVRLPNGELQDDVAVVLCRLHT